MVLAIVTYGHFGSLGPGHMAGYPTMDSIVQIWWLAWAAHAVPHVHNLFLAQGQNYPLGQNFGVNGSMLALGVVFMPITKLFGPVVTWNVLLRLALAASATSMCLVLRRWTTWWPAAFLGGLLYGFSAYTSLSSTYLFLIFVPLPPLVFLLLHEILVRQRWRPGRTGVLLALVLILQFFISTEILAMTVVMGAIATAVFVLINRRSLIERWRYAVTAFAYSLGVACLLLFYPMWFTFAGPQHLNGAPETAAVWGAVFPEDLLSLITQHASDPKQVSLVWGGLAYVGAPLIIALAFFAVFFRKRGAILFAGAMAMIAFVLSLGPRLWIDGHPTQISLPFTLFEHLPALDGFQSGRFSLFTDMFAAAMFAIGIDELWKRLRTSRHRVRLPLRWNMVGSAVVVGVVAVAVTIPLVPSQTKPAIPTAVPTFFTSSEIDSIPPGSVVLGYPYPDDVSSRTWVPIPSMMLYQAVSGMRFKLIGGYGYFPSPTGHGGTTEPAPLRPQSVQALFDLALLPGEKPADRLVLSSSNLTSDLRKFLRKFNVQTVIVLGHPAVVVAGVTAAIGPPVNKGGVTVWFHVRQRLTAVMP